MEKLAEIFQDSRQMQDVVSAILRMEKSMEAMANRVASTTAGVKVIREETEKIGKSAKKTTDDAIDFFAQTEAKLSNIQRVMQSIKGYAGALLPSKDSLEGLGQQLQRMMHSTDALKNKLVDVANKVPYVGTFIGLGLEAQFQKDDRAAKGRQAALAFEGSGKNSVSQIQAVGVALEAEIRRLETASQASREEVLNVYSTFAQGGVKLGAILEKGRQDLEGFDENIASTTLGIDKGFRLAAGTTANFAMQLSRETGSALGKSVDLVAALGSASHASSMSMQAFLGTILQVTSALRVQGSDAESLAGAYFNIEKSFKNLAPGMEDLRRTDLAAQAFAGVSGTVSNMSLGMKGYIAQEVAQRLGVEGLNNMSALRGMDTGFQFMGAKKGADFSGAVNETIYSRFASKTKNEDDLFRYLTQAGGMTSLLAEFMIQTKGKGFSDQKEFQSARAIYEGELKKVGDKAPLENGQFDAWMKKVQGAIEAAGRVASSLLQLLIGTLVDGIGVLVVALTNPSQIGKASSMFSDRLGKNWNRFTGEVGSMGEAVANVYKGAENPLTLGEMADQTKSPWSVVFERSKAVPSVTQTARQRTEFGRNEGSGTPVGTDRVQETNTLVEGSNGSAFHVKVQVNELARKDIQNAALPGKFR